MQEMHKSGIYQFNLSEIKSGYYFLKVGDGEMVKFLPLELFHP